MLKKIYNFLDDRLNPIVVNELRDMVNGKIMLSLTGIVSVFQLSVILFIVLAGGNELGGETGLRIAETIICICSIFTLSLPLNLIGNIRAMRQEKTFDMTYSIMLTPYKTVAGLFFGKLVLIVYSYSLILPFIAIAYLLGGISIVHLLFLLSISSSLVIVIAAFAVLLGLTKMNKSMCYLFTIGLSSFLGMIFYKVVLTANMSYFSVKDLYFIYGLYFTTWILVIYALIALAIPTVSAKNSNRAYQPRIAAWIIFGVLNMFVCGYYLIFDYSQIPFACGIVFIASGVIFTLISVIAASFERIDYGIKVLHLVPENSLRRLIYFFFSSGSSNGIIYGIIWTGIALLGYLLLYIENKLPDETFLNVLISMTVYLTSYSALAIVLRRFQVKKLNRDFSSITFPLIVIIANVLPIIIFCLGTMEFDLDTKSKLTYLFIFSPIFVNFDDVKYFGDILTSVVYCLTIIVTVITALIDYRKFKKSAVVFEVNDE